MYKTVATRKSQEGNKRENRYNIWGDSGKQRTLELTWHHAAVCSTRGMIVNVRQDFNLDKLTPNWQCQNHHRLWSYCYNTISHDMIQIIRNLFMEFLDPFSAICFHLSGNFCLLLQLCTQSPDFMATFSKCRVDIARLSTSWLWWYGNWQVSR